MTTSSHLAWQMNLLSSAPAPQRSGFESPFTSKIFQAFLAAAQVALKCDDHIRSFRSTFEIQQFLYHHYSQISCHFFNQLQSKVTSNSRTLSEYANYRSPWLKKTVLILTTISFQYFWFLWSSTEDFTEGLAVKNDAELWMALTLIGFANGNLSYRVPCWTGTFVPPPKSFLTAPESKCIPCPPGEFPWRVIGE